MKKYLRLRSVFTKLHVCYVEWELMHAYDDLFFFAKNIKRVSENPLLQIDIDQAHARIDFLQKKLRAAHEKNLQLSCDRFGIKNDLKNTGCETKKSIH